MPEGGDDARPIAAFPPRLRSTVVAVEMRAQGFDV